jgi:prolyl oligopeptidase
MTRLAQVPALALLALVAGAPSFAQEVPTPKVDVIDTYHGVTVHDPYRWLEDAADPKVVAWTAAQNARTRAKLDAVPSREAIKARLSALVTRGSATYASFRPRGEHMFAMLNDPTKQQAMLVVLNAAADPASAKVVIDPNAIDVGGRTTIDWFRPSADGRLVAASLSQNGSEIGTLHVYETETGKEIGEPIPRVQAPTAGGNATWLSDNSGFWYTRYPGEERPEADRFFYQQVYFHKLGTDWQKDPLVLGTKDGLPRVAEIFLGSENSRDLIVVPVQNGDGGEFAHFLISQQGVHKLADFKDKVVEAKSSPGGDIFALSRAGAPNGKVVKLQLPPAPFAQQTAALSLTNAPVVVPQSDVTIQLGNAIVVSRTHLMVRDSIGGPNQVRIFDHDGKSQGLLPLPEASSIGEMAALPDGGLIYSVRTYLRPRFVARWNPTTRQSEETKFADTALYGFDDVEVVRETAVSKDGTKVPVNVIRKKGTLLDGTNPTILYGYGGYGISMRPGFLGARTRLWLDGGGIYAIAIIRGGGEFGEEWHVAGNLTKKQNVFDDFAAAARHLVERKYTTPAKLAIFGESNGGLLMGATVTQHPELFRAVVARVGIYDMLRVEVGPNGEFNTTEFGTVKDPEQFKALYAYSPYHHVVQGARYPAIFLATGENDGRVEPWQSRKFAAAMQAASGSGLPVLLRINTSGHGMGSSRNERVEEDADILAFLYDQLGATWRGDSAPPAPK